MKAPGATAAHASPSAARESTNWGPSSPRGRETGKDHASRNRAKQEQLHEDRRDATGTETKKTQGTDAAAKHPLGQQQRRRDRAPPPIQDIKLRPTTGLESVPGRSAFTTRHADKHHNEPTERPTNHERASTSARPRALPTPHATAATAVNVAIALVNAEWTYRRCDTPVSTTGRPRYLHSQQHMQTWRHSNNNYNPTTHRPAGPRRGLV